MDMRVSGAYDAYRIYNSQGKGRVGRTESASAPRDAFTLSAVAEDYQLVRNTLSNLPEIRHDKVNAIKARIESGQYNISASALAEKMIQNVYG